MSTYVRDIRSQPAVLAKLLSAGISVDVRRVLADVSRFDRIVMTGMGASLFGLYPAYLRLANAGLPVWTVETAELLGPAGGLVTERTLLWITSQSGNTAEVTTLLERSRSRPGAILATTNDVASPLAAAADAVLELHSGPEHTVGTRSYVNTLAAMSLAVSSALHEPADPELAAAPDRLADYLADWALHVEELERSVPDTTLYVLGRGTSLAAVLTGALVIKEAAGRPVEGMSVPQFRHGPLEMAGPGVSVVLLAGHEDTRELNREMERDLRRFGSSVAWIDTEPSPQGCRMPDLAGPEARAIAEIIPLQLLSVVLAERAGTLPGTFHKIGKVTRKL